MIGRMAGWGLKSILGMGAKKGASAAIGRFGREALADAAIIGGATQIPNMIGAGIGIADGTLVDDSLDTLSKGPKRNGEYRIGVMDRLKSTLDQMTGGAGITQETIKGRKDENLGREVKPKIELLGGTYVSGLTPGEYGKQIRDLEFEKGETDYRRSQRYIDAKNERKIIIVV